MAGFGVHEAKTHFSKLLERAPNGEEVVVTRSGEPPVTLVPVRRRRTPDPGWATGTFTLPGDVDELPAEFTDHLRRGPCSTRTWSWPGRWIVHRCAPRSR